MATPYIGEIKLVSFNFAPRGWALCNGALLPINQNAALFDLFGTTYGGDGTTTFALPDLQSRIIVGAGHGPGLVTYNQGIKSGVESVTLHINHVPAHTHLLSTSHTASKESPAGSYPAIADNEVYSTAAPKYVFAHNAIGLVGSSEAHENRQPLLVLNYIVALEGIFPTRN